MVTRIKQTMFDGSQKKFSWIFLSVILCIGFFLRFENLDSPSIWVDELNHYYAAKSILEDGTPTFPSGELNKRAELYSRLVAFSFQVFGISEFTLRLPSAIVGMLCIFIGYLIARRFLGEMIGLLTALFVAISPFAIGWSRLSRMYTLFQLLFMVSIYTFYLGFECESKGFFYKIQRTILNKLNRKVILQFFDKWKINIFWICISLIILIVAYFIHQLTALFFVGVLFYLGIMFFFEWRSHNFIEALKSKYFILFVILFGFACISLITSSSLRTFVNYALTYAPKWSEGTRFQDRKLFFDFIFDHFNFPTGTLFIIGVYQVFARLHRKGVYVLSFLIANLFMFTTLFTYRHFQYLYNVYSIFIMISAFAFVNIIDHEFEIIKQNWFSKTKLKRIILYALIVCCFLVWLPLTPSVRLTRRIPLSEDGSFNGAMYMEEWREACNFVKKHLQEDELVISTDALGTLHYLGQVDFDLNFSDFDIAQEKSLINKDGEYFDLYSGKPFIRNLSQLKHLVSQNIGVWILAQHYKLLEAPAFVPIPIREYILENFQKVMSTNNGTVMGYYFPNNKKID